MQSVSKETSTFVIEDTVKEIQDVISDSESDIVVEGNVRLHSDGSITADRAVIKNNTKTSSTASLNKKTSSTAVSQKQDSTEQETSEKQRDNSLHVVKHSEPKTSTYVYILISLGGLLFVFMLLKKLKVL